MSSLSKTNLTLGLFSVILVQLIFYSALQDDIEYNMQGLEGKAGDNKENTINNKQVLSKKRNIQRASALNLVKLAKSKPLEVGQLLRSTPDLLMRLFKVLNNSLESDQPDDHHFMALCAAAVIFFLFRNSLNSEYVTTDCVEVRDIFLNLTISSLSSCLN